MIGRLVVNDVISDTQFFRLNEGLSGLMRRFQQIGVILDCIACTSHQPLYYLEEEHSFYPGVAVDLKL